MTPIEKLEKLKSLQLSYGVSYGSDTEYLWTWFLLIGFKSTNTEIYRRSSKSLSDAITALYDAAKRHYPERFKEES